MQSYEDRRGFLRDIGLATIIAAGGMCAALAAVRTAMAAADEQPLASQDASKAALRSLEAELAKGELWGAPLAAQGFARVALTKEDAAKARELLWQHHAARIASERKDEIGKGELTLGKHKMPLFLKTFGAEPKEGWSLWISMHGGGGAPKAVNDQQWENQKRLYCLEEGIYVAPRAGPIIGTCGTSPTLMISSIAWSRT